MALPNSHNLIYLSNQQEGGDTRPLVSDALRSLLNKDVDIIHARRVGKITPGLNRDILVLLRYYDDKEMVIRTSHNSGGHFYNYHNSKITNVEKAHTLFMKRTLNVSKYASNMCMYSELNRYPIIHNAWALAIKYWRRLCYGTQNVLLNASFKTCVDENQSWLQNVKHTLSVNGFTDAWLNPFGTNLHFHKTFKQRLNDQFMQECVSNVVSSSRFKTLKQLVVANEMSTYLSKINNPDIRKIYTHYTDMFKVFYRS